MATEVSIVIWDPNHRDEAEWRDLIAALDAEVIECDVQEVD